MVSDTRPEAEALVRAAVQRQDPSARVKAALELSEAMRELALSRLRQLHPEKSTLELVELLLGYELIPRN